MEFRRLTREAIEERENEWLAPYAMKSKDTMGRVHEEKEHPYRSVYQRDRDRIIYSNAFRRLEYKTQVFVNHEGDYYRTRLTHTLEVAQIAKTIARSLRLNEELVEAIALVHDVGHTPFGHAGESILAKIMKDHGGFDHNSHGLRVVDILEERYPEFSGLNLTAEVRRGIVMHSTPFDDAGERCARLPGPWLLEIQVVDIADEIAYDNHDLDDGLKSGLLSGNDMGGISIWKQAENGVKEEYGVIDVSVARSQAVRYLINLQVTDVIQNALENINSKNIKSTADLLGMKYKIVTSSPDMQVKREELRKHLIEHLYKNYRVIRMSNKAARFLKSLFTVYLENPEQLPPNAKAKISERGEHRAICDYIAGMTDRYALDQYKKLFEPYERV